MLSNTNKKKQQKALLLKGRNELSKIYYRQKQFISETEFIFEQQTDKMKINNNFYLDFGVIIKTRNEL